MTLIVLERIKIFYFVLYYSEFLCFPSSSERIRNKRGIYILPNRVYNANKSSWLKICLLNSIVLLTLE